MLRSAIVAAVVIALCLCSPASAASFGTLNGVVIGKEISYGPSGLINQILLILDTQDGMYWSVTCRRAEANLGRCINVEQLDIVSVDGVFRAGPTGPASHLLSPLSLFIL